MKYLKTFYLYESQVFDFDKWKTGVIRIIDKIKKDEKLLEMDFNVIYHIIRNPGHKDNYLSLGFTQIDSKNWKSYFTNDKFFEYNGAWSQRNFNNSLKRDLKIKSGNRTYNYYITLTKTKENILKFWDKLLELDKQLRLFSDNKKTPISYKLHSLLEGLVNDNDSFKIYYYDYSFKNNIENIIKNWIKDNNIKIEERTHTHGVDANNKSYGQLLVEIIIKTLSDIVKKFGDKYTTEQYYEWLKTNMPDIIKNVKLKEEN